MPAPEKSVTDAMAERIPLSEPTLDGNELAYLTECIESNWVSSAGAFVERFERQVADYIGRPHAVAMVNGTAALHLALKVAGVAAGDEVLVSSLSFIAPANAIRHAGAWPVLVDAEEESWQMDVDLVRNFLESGCERQGRTLVNRQTGRRVGALLPVHILGHSCDMAALKVLAEAFALPLVEDATESLGGTCEGQKLGAVGDIACFSFNGNKLVTSGGGGMIVTGREDWARHARHLSTQARVPGGEYIHDEVGYNYRLTNLQAAVGVAQMERITAMLAAKQRIAATYRDMCADTPGLSFMPTPPWAGAMHWLSAIRVEAREFGVDARELRDVMGSKGIETRPLWQPLHQSPALAGAAALGGETAERLYREVLCLPSSVSLDARRQGMVVAAVLAAASNKKNTVNQ